MYTQVTSVLSRNLEHPTTRFGQDLPPIPNFLKSKWFVVNTFEYNFIVITYSVYIID